ncbi:uncharacterized protein LOC129880696 [Solanum dulcamara]|uniref:uncharacterized protein LOC129880696 n=1 Tax=Solanum dulcamara TaxID=45834 RepID=UPI002485EA29|nr:uncharacterized protein LOC129880696 [Solanum dulcamara]XP_055810832.1 uncharacterized protein LOC129880696 [Solanum dulcamara]
MNNEIETDIIEETKEQVEEYKQDIFIDKRKLKQIQKEKFSLTNYSGFDVNILDRFGLRKRQHHLFYGLNIQERALEVSVTSNKIMIPLLSKKDIQDKLKKIKTEIQNTLGWIHIGAIQIIIKFTFREGLDTPIDLAIIDNSIINRKEACLEILRGNLQYGKIKFNVYPRISYHLLDKNFDKTLSLIQDFKRKDFFHKYNRPYSITYIISYAISNTHHSDCFVIKETIDYPHLFEEVSQIQMPNITQIQEIEDTPLDLDLQSKSLYNQQNSTSRLSFEETRVINPTVMIRRTQSERVRQPILEAKNDEIKNYKIKGEYFNGIQFVPINILLDTGASGNYISLRLCNHLQQYKLKDNHLYTDFNGKRHEITNMIETILKFKDNTIPIRLLVEPEGNNDMLEILLGTTFLDSVKPYDILDHGIKITYNDKIISISK